ncbi:MR1BB-like protein [Mya arenaria]|uniref:MR1BB-like protein n=1 Tax=Mya arenaria TaxID=6604 RepID=A0ABY7EL99_MYAAR|nr:MR1BB-like protein [Mya arenaria]
MTDDVDADDLHPMFQEMLERTDDWRPGENVSSLDYNFLSHHPAMSIFFLVIGAILSYRPLRNKGNMFVVNLPLADICITSIVSPMNMICKPFIYHRIYIHKKTILYCVGLWIWAMLLDLPNWVGWGGHTFALKEMGCTFDRLANYGYTIFMTTMSIFLPMTIVLSCYIAILIYVRNSRREVRKFGGSENTPITIQQTWRICKENVTNGRRKSTLPGHYLDIQTVV